MLSLFSAEDVEDLCRLLIMIELSEAQTVQKLTPKTDEGSAQDLDVQLNPTNQILSV